MTLKIAVRTILKASSETGCPARLKCEDSFCVAYNTVRKYLKQ